MGSTRQGQGLNEAVCWAEGTTGQDTYLPQLPLCLSRTTHYMAIRLGKFNHGQGLESAKPRIAVSYRKERYHLPSVGHSWNHGNPFLNPGHIRRRYCHASFLFMLITHVHTSEVL